MKQYVGVKLIEAQEMTRFEAQEKGLIRDIKHVDEQGYIVKYSDDYSSWSPKNTFDKAYTELEQDQKNMRQKVCDICEEANEEQDVFLPQTYMWAMLKRFEKYGFTFLKN